LQALAVLGLSGAHQVHVAPVLLRIDRRAHQVYVGFHDLSRVVKGHAWIVRGESALPVTLEDLKAVPEDAAVVVPASETENPGGIAGVVWLVDRLLGPGGCPWDQEQTHESLKRHLIEECYELVQAIDDGDEEKMKEELGDVLLQPVMHAQMKARDGGFDTDEVAELLVEKLVRRHPHVFGDAQAHTADQVLRNWDAIKKQEKGSASILDGVPRAMPALLRAFEVSKRAARAGFEWPNVEGVWQKMHEEERELKQAQTPEEKEDEVGDLLFTAVNVARWSGVEPEDALRRMLDRFTLRFQAMEKTAPKPLQELNEKEWDELWERVKMEQQT
jgi:tetrapyrrole methylase family protein/MazG family protein